jgi:hypothetical protein
MLISNAMMREIDMGRFLYSQRRLGDHLGFRIRISLLGSKRQMAGQADRILHQ